MNMLKMCLNWKVLGGLAAVGIGIWIVAPGALANLLPLLLLAACPLSMMFMMRGMGGMGGGDAQGTSSGEYTCPMHPNVRQTAPGRCPQCGMALVPAAPRPAASGNTHSRSEELTGLKSEMAAMEERQQTIAREIARLEAVDATSGKEMRGRPAR